MNKIECDGCGCNLTSGRGPALTGERANGMVGGGMPSGDFHLCFDCGVFVFDALRDRREVQAAGKP